MSRVRQFYEGARFSFHPLEVRARLMSGVVGSMVALASVAMTGRYPLDWSVWIFGPVGVIAFFAIFWFEPLDRSVGARRRMPAPARRRPTESGTLGEPAVEFDSLADRWTRPSEPDEQQCSRCGEFELRVRGRDGTCMCVACGWEWAGSAEQTVMLRPEYRTQLRGAS